VFPLVIGGFVTPEQATQIAELHEQGVSNREIARTVGLTHTTVAKVLKVETSGGGNPVETSSGNPLIGRRLSPKELLDAKEAGTLPWTARLNGGGAVYVPEPGEPVVWPSFEPTGDVLLAPPKSVTGTINVVRPLKPREAHRATPVQ
jgi:hypothetical protein